MDVSNVDQADFDVDGVGDVCDPYPFSQDNLGACLIDVGQLRGDIADRDSTIQQLENENTYLQSQLIDTDMDGVLDQHDLCRLSPAGEDVNHSGCTKIQFCGSIDVTSAHGIKRCNNSSYDGIEIQSCMMSNNSNNAGGIFENGMCIPAK